MNINGKELRITPASYKTAMSLTKAIGRALKGTSLELPDNVTAEISPEKMGDIFNAILNVAISDDVEAALFACAETAVYGPTSEKINQDFFDKVENRELFYPIMLEIIKANVGPFFKGLSSKLSAAVGQLGKSLN